MRKFLLVLVVLTALLLTALAGCSASSDTPSGTPGTPSAGGESEATDENPFIGRWSFAGGYVEYLADGTWTDSFEDAEGTVTTNTGSYEVVVGDGYYELRELWDDPEVSPMVTYVVFEDGKAGFFESIEAINQGDIMTTYTETAPGQWAR